MPVRTFDEWAESRLQSLPLTMLRDSVLGIDAAHYLDRLLTTSPSKEPLLSALGGFPLALKNHVEHELKVLRALRITPLFVFSGMDFAVREKPLKQLREAAKRNSHAWELYNQHEAIQAVDAFGNSGSIGSESLFRFLQKILHANAVEYLVAPYSVWAQLAYLDQDPGQFVDAIMGSSELFLFDVDRVITRIDFDHVNFSWISRRTCQEELGKISADLFVDACLLCGSPFLPTFPPLENPVLYPKPFTIRDAVTTLLTLGRSVTAVCTHYQDEPQLQQLDYLDRYRRARLAVKHHIVVTEEARIEPLNFDLAPSDIHEFIGQRLPDELYFYLSRAVVGPRVLNWLTSGEIFNYPPLDGSESPEYHRLVQEQLVPYRKQALALLSQPLQRFYHRKDVIMRFWFSKDLAVTLSREDLVPSPRTITSSWNVRESAINGRVKTSMDRPGSLSFAIRTLHESEFFSRTVIPRDGTNPLTTQPEILCNTIWRFLHLRGYTDDAHAMTIWGKALYAALSELNPVDHLEEPVLIAIELLRLGLFKTNTVSLYTTNGGPICGSEMDKECCLLISRVACLAKLSHKPIGFTGPLSRILLCFHSFINAVRESLHDTVEMVLANMLLNGDISRDRQDWTELGLKLPFIDDNDCALGIAVKSYLDELATQQDPTHEASKELAMVKGPEEWFLHAVNMRHDIKMAFRLWDAVIRAVSAAGEEIQEREHWKETDKWLAQRR